MHAPKFKRGKNGLDDIMINGSWVGRKKPAARIDSGLTQLLTVEV